MMPAMRIDLNTCSKNDGTSDGRDSVIDLFCGAGGLSLGLARAGFKSLLAIDTNKSALKTYAYNLGDQAIQADLSQKIDLPKATVIAGGPPCQGFSSAGLRQADDQRNNLVACFAQIVAELRPLAFIFENVEGFLTAEHGDRVIDLLTPLIDAGYWIHLRKVNKESSLNVLSPCALDRPCVICPKNCNMQVFNTEHCGA